MNITIIGTGYVGLITGVGFASAGHHVSCVDTDENRISALGRGVPSFFEAGLEQALNRELASGRISFSTQLTGVRRVPHVVFLCVGTPSAADGSTDLSDLKRAVSDVASWLRPGAILVVKSTVPVGTAKWIESCLAPREDSVQVVSNPEFLREGSALADNLHPQRTVIGTRHRHAADFMKRLYSDLEAPLLWVTPEAAELIKHASNAFLALKISYINLLADFCDHFGTDVRQVAEGMGLDSRIAMPFLKAGLGFGGSCFPKDVRSLAHQFRDAGLGGNLFEETLRINESRVTRAVDKVRETLGSLVGCRIAILGLSFKPHSSDVRESQSLRLLQALIDEGCEVCAYDPIASAEARREYPTVPYCESALDAVKGVDAVLLATDWPQFHALPWRDISYLMRGHLILDCRNQLDGPALGRLGFLYKGMGIPGIPA